MHPFESVANTVNVELPGVVGVPMSAPLLVFKVNPAGNAPLVLVYV
jgi:hypothetical protein